MAHWGAIAMLVGTGIAILVAWGWIWLGLTRSMRRIALERLYPWSSTAAIPKVQAVIWPAMPMVGFAWIGVGGMTVRIASGHDPMPAAVLVALLFGAILVLGVLALLDQELPGYCYPGWRAKRYYLKHPERAQEELDARVGRRLLETSRAA
ncbi:MAG: hypothetical protein SOX57_04000 [Schaalia hyovaginalis]|uniref:hypothetical protein n=1 Tax=Schaalia TaxID=2529408 RepID=UPI0012B2CAAB|nr:hypothetical protein [Schaalia hyovaginalis]MCI6411127.1 hypothetical protein [Schaalia hyovaginalis]MCI6557462.1 hypothetical protein [Schaalia hyovaginalis]MCI7512320.1 hypothetical protein [Schaalia hyovaginalis]MDD7554226.1 hypothetical protein [Schaalia hyovaginalis]MDY3092922.1 hypothetical protein [Schaalia hyovaginalis]